MTELRHFESLENQVKKLGTPEDLAEKANFKSVMSVYRLVAKGILPHYRFGRQIRFDLDEVPKALRVEAK